MTLFLLDTNIPSELLRPRPDVGVVAWLEQHTTKEVLHLSVVTIGELIKGSEEMEPGRRRTALEQSIQEVVPSWFEDRILPVTRRIAERWGFLSANRKRAGRPLGMADGLIAATALEHDLVVVTRNVRHFQDLGVTLINPWEAAA